MMRRLIPPPTLLWAALGRSAFPVMRDTAVRRDSAFLRADLGKPVEWRATFRQDTLIRLERVAGDRVMEWVDRGTSDRVTYRQETARRTLRLRITDTFTVGDFHASIWSLGR